MSKVWIHLISLPTIDYTCYLFLHMTFLEHSQGFLRAAKDALRCTEKPPTRVMTVHFSPELFM